MKNFNIVFIFLTLFFSGCIKEEPKTEPSKDKNYSLFKTKFSNPFKSKNVEEDKQSKKLKTVKSVYEEKELVPELDFEVQNSTGKTIYITCFSYIQEEKFTRWRWDKSPIYRLEDGDNVIVNVDSIKDNRSRKHTYGFVAVFDNEKDARDSIYELLQDVNKVELDQLYKLKDKKVVLTVDKYGFKKDILEFLVKDRFKRNGNQTPELDFPVENKTGKTIFVTCFVYEINDDMRSVWHYDKTPVLKLLPGQLSLIDVDTITRERDRENVAGYIGIFDEDQEQAADDSTYQLLKSRNRLDLGKLKRFKNKKLILEIEKYGTVGDIPEIAIRPVKYIFPKKGQVE